MHFQIYYANISAVIKKSIQNTHVTYLLQFLHLSETRSILLLPVTDTNGLAKKKPVGCRMTN